MWRSRSTRSAWCFVCSVISAGAATGGAGNDSGRGRTGRGAGDIVGRFGGSLELIVQVLRRFVPDRYAGPLRPARTPARRGRCPGQRRDPAYHQGQRVHRWRQRPADRASELEQALRRADVLRGMEIRSASASTNCAPCAMPACSACRRCSATCRRSRRAEPRRGGQSRQGFRRTRGSPASAAACRANNAMGRYPPILLKPAQVLSDILFLSFSAFRRRRAGRGR